MGACVYVQGGIDDPGTYYRPTVMSKYASGVAGLKR